MKCFGALALAVLVLSNVEAFTLKKATKALGSYALIKALEPKPPQMVAIMMPMPMIMDTPASMMEAAKPMAMMESAKAAMMMGANSAMMMGGNSAMMTMATPMMKESMMEQAGKPPMMGTMKIMMNTPNTMKAPLESTDRQAQAALHALEHNHAHHHAH